MIVSILCGIVISKFVRERNITFLAAIVIGTLIGFLGAIGVFGMVYPFYIAVDTDVVHIPELVPFGVYFIIPQIKIFSFSSAWLSSVMPLVPLLAILFVITSIVSVFVGYTIERRWLCSNNVSK